MLGEVSQKSCCQSLFQRQVLPIRILNSLCVSSARYEISTSWVDCLKHPHGSQWRVSATAFLTPWLGLCMDHRVAENASRPSCQGPAGTILAHDLAQGQHQAAKGSKDRWAPESIKNGVTATHGPREKMNHLGAKGGVRETLPWKAQSLTYTASKNPL